MRDLNWTPAIWLLLVVVCGALFLDGLDLSMIGVALPSIGRSLHLSAGSLQWIVSGYVLGYGSFLLLGGRTSDLVSRRTVFLTAVTVFGVASVISAGLSNEVALVALRFIKGASAGFTVPAGLSILTTTFAEGPARNKALGIYSLCGASGFSLGLVLGGLLTEIGWRAPFLLPGPVALVLVAVGWRVIPRARPRDRAPGPLRPVRSPERHRFAAPAGVLGRRGPDSRVGQVPAPSRCWPRAWRSWGRSSSLSFAMSTLWSASASCAIPPWCTPTWRAFAMFGSYVAFQFIVTLYVQDSLGWSPITMALAFLPAGIIVVLGAPRIGPILQRLGTATTILFGMLAFAVGYALFLRVTPSMPYVEFMLPTMLLLGIGFGLSFAALNGQATAGVADHEQGLASGLLNTSLQLGGAIVLAVVTAILGTRGIPVHDQLLPGMKTAIYVVVGVSTGAVVLTLAFLYRSRRKAVAVPVLVEAPGNSSEDDFQSRKSA